MDYPNKLLENRLNTFCKIVEEFAPKSQKKFLQNRRTGQNCRRTCSKITQELAPKLLENLLNNHRKTCSKIARKLARSCKRTSQKWLKTCYKSVEGEIEKTRTRSLEELRLLSTVVRSYYKLLYGRSTAILMDTAPFRVNDVAIARPCYGSLTVAVLW